jgi:Mg/Co/Ni transporter MgtE
VIELVKTTEVLVRDLMKKTVAIKEETKIEEILEIFKKERISLIPIVDKNNVLIGTVTEQDLIKLIKSEPISPLAGAVWSDVIDKSHKDKPVKEIMNTKTISISPNESIDSALKMMNNYNLKVLTVVDSENKLVGIIRLRDIFERFLKEE